MSKGGFIINPGSGPVDGATLQHALHNIAVFATELNTHSKQEWTVEGADGPVVENEGRYAFVLRNAGKGLGNVKRALVEMPGLPLSRVRFVDGKNPFDFPRLYVDGNSWLWPFAISQCLPEHLAGRR